MARTMEKLEDAVKTASAELGYMSLKQKQLEVVTAFLSGRDVLLLSLLGTEKVYATVVYL